MTVFANVRIWCANKRLTIFTICFIRIFYIQISFKSKNYFLLNLFKKERKNYEKRYSINFKLEKLDSCYKLANNKSKAFFNLFHWDFLSALFYSKIKGTSYKNYF